MKYALFFILLLGINVVASATEDHRISYEIFTQRCTDRIVCTETILVQGETKIQVNDENDSFAGGVNTVNLKNGGKAYKIFISLDKLKKNKSWGWELLSSALVSEKGAKDLFVEAEIELPVYVVNAAIVLSLPNYNDNSPRVRITLL